MKNELLIIGIIISILFIGYLDYISIPLLDIRDTQTFGKD
jgi:hypothetical protein